MLHSAPESYGMSSAETLAHAVTSTRPPAFDAFWSAFGEELADRPAAWQGQIDGEINTVVLSSIRSVRVMARVTCPSPAPRGVVVTTHGYAADDDWPSTPDSWSDDGLATVRVRVRGFPPSTVDVDDLRESWIVHNVQAPDDWILRGAVADVCLAVLGARLHFGHDTPVCLHGESFGGGLAVLAAAHLTRIGAPPARLAIGLPTFGDWAWRRGRYCNGAGALVNDLLVAMREDDREILESLAVFDAAHHAADIQCPTLCKLATRDDVVPAPSAAAVFNAMDAELRWRFVTRFGHYEGGLADARRHLVFELLQRSFLDPALDPADVIRGTRLPLELEGSSQAVN